MKLIRLTVWTLLQVVLVVVALDGALAWLGSAGPHPVWELLPLWIHPVGETDTRALWLALVLLIGVYWLTNVAVWQRRPKALRVRTPEGDHVLIHPGTFQKFVRAQIEMHESVVSQKVRVRQSGRSGISVWAHVKVQPTRSLPAIKRELEDSIRRGFEEIMGITKIDQVLIILGLDEDSMNVRPGAKKQAQSAPEPPLRTDLESPLAASEARDALAPDEERADEADDA